MANFRCGGDVNLLVTTQSGLAAASTLPKCNLVASFHPSNSIDTYLLAKSRLRLVSVKTTKARLWHFLEPSKMSIRNRYVLSFRPPPSPEPFPILPALLLYMLL